MKIHYRNQHGTTNIPWQKAFSKYGELSLGSISSGNFPEEIDHLHLGGSCKGIYSNTSNPITVADVKSVQLRTGCAVSMFFGDTRPKRFEFHHGLLDANIPRLKVYSAALYETSMWRPDVNWVLHPTDENIFQLVEHKENSTVLFVGSLTPYRKKIITKLFNAGIKVDVVGRGGNIHPKFGEDLTELSKNYTMSIGIDYDGFKPKIRYSSSRLPNTLALGLVYIETNFDLREVFNSNEIIQWVNIDDLIDKIRYYHKNHDEGYEIMMRGRKKILDNWTFNKLARQFIEGINREKE